MADPNGTSVLLLHNFHKFLTSSEVIQTLFTQLIAGKERRTFFVVLSPAEQATLRAQGFDFYDWTAPEGAPGAARLVTAWNTDPAHACALARAISAL